MRFGAEAFGQEKTPHEKRKRGLGLEQRAAFPVAGWWAGLALWPGLLRRSLPRASPLCSPTSVFRQPSITRPESRARPRALGYRCTPQGWHLCRGLTGAGRRGALRLSPPRARAARLESTAFCWPQAEPDLHSPGAVCALEIARPSRGHWGQEGPSAPPASPASQPPGGSVKTP